MLLFLFFILTSCNPLATKPGSVAETNFRPGYIPNSAPSETRAFDANYDFNNSAFFIPDTNLNSSMNNYVSINASSSGLAELTAIAPIDNTSSDFGSGTYGANSYFDSSNGGISLSGGSSATNNSELDASWTPQWSNILGYWRLNSTLNDFSPNASSSSLTKAGTGTTFTANSKVGSGAANFNGTDDSLTFPAGLLPSGSSARSFSVWAYSTKSSNGALFCYGNISLKNLFEFGQFGGNLIFHWFGGYTSVTPVITSIWRHYVITYNGSSINVYVDGNLLATNTIDLNTSGTLHYNIGNGYLNRWQGYVDDFAVWGNELSPSEVKTIYRRQAAKYSSTYRSRIMDSSSTNAPWTSLKFRTPYPFGKELKTTNEPTTDYNGSNMVDNLGSGMVGRWSLNESSGTTISDTGSGTPANGSCINCPIMEGVGPFGNSMLFSGNSSGTGNYYSIPYNSKLENASAITYAGWYKTTGSGSAGDSCSLIWHGESPGVSPNWGNITRLDISHVNSGKAQFLVVNSSDGAVKSIVGSTSLYDGKWHLVTGTYDQSVGYVRIYIDGSLQNSLAFSGLIKSSSGQYTIGSQKPNYNIFCNGSIDEVAIWNRALTQTEITQLYRRGANRVKFQTRYCANNDCSDQTGSGSGWRGPDGTYLSYFSELNNSSGSGPTISLSSGSGSGRYFQYRTILESDDNSASPTSPLVSLVQPGPTHYYNGGGAAITTGSNQALPFTTLSGFTATLGSNGCSGSGPNGSGVGFQLSNDNSTWKYWNGSTWSNSSGANQFSPESVVNSNISSFPGNTLYVRTILNSSGTTPCEVNNISITGQKN